MRLNLEKLPDQTKKSSLLITISGLVSKFLAAIYRIPYQNLVGDRGFYAYQQIYPFLAIISALSLTALPNVIASIAQRKKPDQLKTLFALQLILSVLFATGLFIWHRQLAFWIGTPKLAPAIILTGCTLLTVPFISFYRGLSQAKLDMAPTAISQVMEQIIRIVIIIVAALCCFYYDWTIYLMANVAASGNLIASLIVLIYLKQRSDYSLISFLKGHLVFKEMKNIGLSVFIFTFYAIYLLIFQLIDSFFVKNSLVSSGYSEILAEVTKGLYDRGQPLIQFGLIFTTALFTSYLPRLTQLHHHDKKDYQKESQFFFEFICYFNLTLTAGYVTILHLMNQLLFEDNQAWLPLALYLGVIFLSSVIQFCHQKCFIENLRRKSFYILSIGILVKLVLTPILTYYYGILGSSLSTLLPLVFVLCLYVFLAQINLTTVINVKYFLALLVMILVMHVIMPYLPVKTRLQTLASLLIVAVSGLLVFLLLCRKFLVFHQKLWSFLPFIKEKW
ncbi:oligosaccharide flippase family protein [Streptococcus ictaluri]|uniref:Polysaccharide biosynthesis protein n=1 Tax=Streptococcus ictaluri 707-05 TaxID=764299 RepID=G5K0K1_9STRE|nr:oligosaccharide flippase family protein [Streptococcus ictaluri]EHI70530.1 polysaccharide biosynthesis protein [Streptococcus ictaluri 707-05]